MNTRPKPPKTSHRAAVALVAVLVALFATVAGAAAEDPPIEPELFELEPIELEPAFELTEEPPPTVELLDQAPAVAISLDCESDTPVVASIQNLSWTDYSFDVYVAGAAVGGVWVQAGGSANLPVDIAENTTATVRVEHDGVVDGEQTLTVDCAKAIPVYAFGHYCFPDQAFVTLSNQGDESTQFLVVPVDQPEPYPTYFQEVGSHEAKTVTLDQLPNTTLHYEVSADGEVIGTESFTFDCPAQHAEPGSVSSTSNPSTPATTSTTTSPASQAPGDPTEPDLIASVVEENEQEGNEREANEQAANQQAVEPTPEAEEEINADSTTEEVAVPAVNSSDGSGSKGSGMPGKAKAAWGVVGTSLAALAGVGIELGRRNAES